MNNLPLRSLLLNEIRSIINTALPKGGNKLAIENFLMSIAQNETVDNAAANLKSDAEIGHWNEETVSAICDGILLAADMVEGD